MLRDRLLRPLARVRRAVLVRRRPLAALLVAVAVGSGVQAATAPPPRTVPVLTAAHDLPAGTTLAERDLVLKEFAPGSAPAAALPTAVGRTLAAPLSEAEPVTDVRLVGPGPVSNDPTRTALPVRLPDAGMATLLTPGDRIDLLATDPQGSGTQVVAADAFVLAVPAGPSGPAGTGESGRIVLVGTDPSEVTTVAEAGARLFLTYSFSR